MLLNYSMIFYNVYLHVYRNPRSASVVLPSYLKRRRSEKCEGGSAAVKKAKVTIWDKGLICLPRCCASGNHVSFPRGKYRIDLGRAGLIGKVCLKFDMMPLVVLDEIRSTFKRQDGRADFPFEFLQPTGCGTSAMTIPNVSSLFEWTPHQVAKLSTTKGNIFILAKERLTVDDELGIEVCKYLYTYYIWQQRV